jgi:hypothetical protein
MKQLYRAAFYSQIDILLVPASHCYRVGFDTKSGHVGFVEDKLALGQGFSECFGFSCKLTFYRLLHNHHHHHHHPGLVTDQIVADMTSGLGSPHTHKNSAFYFFVKKSVK